MSESTESLTGFLLARIADDQFYAENFCHERESHQEACPKCKDRALAECEAKRRIVERHAEGVDYTSDGTKFQTGCSECGCEDFAHVVAWPCPTLRAIAAVYADHPDYREEWKP